MKNVLNFWFNQRKPKDWLKKNQNVDNKIREKFNNLIEQALNNRLDFWPNHREDSLARILLSDLFTRNIFREDKNSFYGDKKAQQISLKCAEEAYLSFSTPEWYHFILIPMMHSENLII